MAIVVIVIMFGFIGGSALMKMMTVRGNPTIAKFGQKGKITNMDLYYASRDMELLSVLRADELLKSQDLQGILLGELLFPDRTTPEFMSYVRQSIRTNQFKISDKQLNDMYYRTVTPSMYWILLSNEAESAGISIPNEQVGQQFSRVIPQLFGGQSYSQTIGAIMNQRSVTEEQILSTLGRLLAILQYARVITSDEDLTTRQIMQAASYEQEEVEVQFVRFDSGLYAESQPQPDADQLLGQFEKYKDFSAGDFTTENPYGFGYMLPDRVQLEYIAVRLNEVRNIVKAPSQDQMEDYYERYKEQLFTEQVRSDPNDPNSEMVPRVKSYAEVARSISEQILQDNIDSTAERILQEAKTITEAGLEGLDVQSSETTSGQIKEKVGDYKTAAEQLSKKYNIKVYAGRTGLLSPVDIQTDEYLRRLYMPGSGGGTVGLSKIVFAVDELGLSELSRLDVAKPRMYTNIGPLYDMWRGLQSGTGPVTAIVRITQALKASVPESIVQTYSTCSLKFDPNQFSDEQPASEDDVYSVKNLVVADMKRLAAMEVMKGKVDNFVDQVTSGGWDVAVNKFNEQYKQQQGKKPSDPNVVMLRGLPGLKRISKSDMEVYTIQNQGNPMSKYTMSERWKRKRFIEQLYSLVPQDSNSLNDMTYIMEFKPDMSFYVIRNISIKRLWKEQYEKAKPMLVFGEDQVESQSLAVVHFNPQNILERMRFKEVEVKTRPVKRQAPPDEEIEF